MLNRLNHVSSCRNIYRDFEEVKSDLAGGKFTSTDKQYFSAREKWETILEHLFDVFPSDRSYADNWSFCSSGSMAGISNFTNGTGEDTEAVTNLSKICNSAKGK